MIKLNSFPPLRQRSAIAGFTLIELLVALVLLGIVVSLAGFGVVSLMQANQKSESETARRTNLNRTLDFISDEIRMAKQVSSPSSNSLPTPVCGTATGVLDLTMPDNSHIIYYLNNIDSCGNTGWQGPATIRRVAGGNDALLMDAVIVSATAPACTGGTLTGGSNGFYACLDSTNNRLVSLYLNGKLTDGYGNVIGTYPVSSKIVLRSQ